MTSTAARAFRAATGREPQGLWFAPGRVNVIGEHTDYNDGFVLPMALPQRTVAAAALRTDRRCVVRSLHHPGEEPSFDPLTVKPGDVDGWVGYVAGVAWALREVGVDVPPVDLLLASDVPVGAGLSSSASVECVAAVAFAALAGVELDATTLALAAQRAENDFVGVPCGIMDQMASMHGRSGHVLFLDTRSQQIEQVPFDLAAVGLALLVIDTRAPHQLVDGEYAARRRTCEEAAAALGLPALRDVTDLDDALSRLPDPVARRRVRHVVTEDERVVEVAARLRRGDDPRGVGPLLTQSHASMRDDYEITVPEVDLAVEAALDAGAFGARMTGGGFGGCVIALVDTGRVHAVQEAVGRAFAAHGFTAPEPFIAVPSAGAGRL